jgi:hypothetical protein
MTIDDAIKQLLNEAEKWESLVNGAYKLQDRDCAERAADHRQLAEWLTELKQWRRVYGICPSYEMCIPECKEGYNAQITEYKRLLKAAVEDIYKARQGCNCNICDIPTESIEKCQYENGEDCKFKWRYADEALKLIGGSEND